MCGFERIKLFFPIPFIIMATGGALLGWSIDTLGPAAIYWPPFPGLAYRSYPLPHHVPKYPGGLSLRFAMVHDVIHERYPRHGKAYYEERNRKAGEELKRLGGRKGLSARYFALLDDLTVGLEALGRPDEAARVMRDKLGKQEESGQKGLDLYTTYANLGTFLIHGNISRAIRGDDGGKQRVREGLERLRLAIKVNRRAHFGREGWQVKTGDFLLAASENPGLLLKYDIVGNSLDYGWLSSRAERSPIRGRARHINSPDWKEVVKDQGITFEWGGPKSESDASVLREHIRHIARRRIRDADWDTHRWKDGVPFDEPALGIIGMWRLGGGANPHFALALGNIMIQVGQTNIAWTAYERAVKLADRLWPDPQIQKELIAFCRSRQAAIENELSEEERREIRERFDGELAFGQKYQKAYQDFEERQLEKGVQLDDPHFYDDFNAQHGEIASPVGPEDQMVVIHHNFLRALPLMVLLAGVFGFATACIQWRRARATYKLKCTIR